MQGNIRIVLVGTTHAGNAGAAARAMKVMGLESLVLVAPRCQLDEEAYARASGAVDVLDSARIVKTVGEAIDGVRFVAATSARARRLGPEPTALREGVAELASALRAGDAAVVFGPERTGLDNDTLDRCNRLWHIPTGGGYGSLNLAAAVQVVAYELLMARDGGRMELRPPPAATEKEVADLCVHFDRVARRVGYLDAAAPRLALRRVRRLARRARLEPAEVKLLRGFLSAAEGRSTQRPETFRDHDAP